MKLTEREAETIIDKLREAESMILMIFRDASLHECWNAASDCKVLIWKAIDKAGDLAR